MPFGVTNGGPIFQRIMTDIIKEDHLVCTFVYFDNVIIGSNSLQELEARASMFRRSMEKRAMTLNESKTVYGVTELNMLGYCVGNNTIKPDPERLRPLLEMPAPMSHKSLQRILGMFAYYAKWIPRFSDRISELKSARSFPLKSSELLEFEGLKNSISKAALQTIDESLPFTVECDASDVAVSATLNQNGRPVAFMSRSLSGPELSYPAIEKEATAIIESVRKWEHLLLRQKFTLITDQRSVAFMMDARRRTKIKHNKIMSWRLELASFAYSIRYRPGKQNLAADALTWAFCSSVSTVCKLDQLHKDLCCPGVTRLWHFVRSKNLPYSMDDIKKCCGSCGTCAEVKPQFYSPGRDSLVKATQPMERLNIDFKGPLPSSSRNAYFLCVIDEYSRYPFCFPCGDMSAATLIACMDKIFRLFGTCQFVHSDRGPSLMSREFKDYLLRRGIATSRTTPYHPTGNAQCERYNGVLWKAIRCALKSRGLALEKWESVVPMVLDATRSLLCTSTGDTPHSRFLKFNRRSFYGNSLPSWLCKPGPVFLRKFVRSGKNDDLVRKVELLEANPTYARVRYDDGRESNVSIRDIARYPREGGGRRCEEADGRVCDDDEPRADDTVDQERTPDMTPDNGDNNYRDAEDIERPKYSHDDNDVIGERSDLRRSTRQNKGVPPERFGYPSCPLCFTFFRC